ncbi:neuropeptide receptor A23-like protein [Leptotrombidium deliense]|uniref:Neuropeptide receptor A23-like protein n=1 Tax=Leptotrombidium deliense TaxID=299467 RepID=A0A443SGC9_9ACAR|nr:neuropeptide receptor A23-like protein [Leptotrombidium deliense]
MSNVKISMNMKIANSSSLLIQDLERNVYYLNNNIRDVVFLVILTFSATFAVISNCFTIKVIATEKNMKSKTNYLIANMAFSDAIAGLIIMLEYIFCSAFFLKKCGTFVCSSLQVIISATYCVSSFTMTTIACERFLGIVAKPLGVSSKPMKKIIIIWLLGFLFSLPIFSMVMIPEYFSSKNIFSFRLLDNYQWTDAAIRIKLMCNFVIQFLLPLVVTTIAYFKVMKAVKNRPILASQITSHRMKFDKQKVKLIRMFALIVGLFTLAWLPLHLSTLYSVIAGMKIVDLNYVPTALLCLTWLCASTICFNPIIYFWFHKPFRKQARNTWKLITFSSSQVQIE